MKSGFVALAGRPNTGKSTLVNAICGIKIAIASDKPQTTRHRIAGVANGEGYQLVLVDLPGFQRPRDALTARMQRTVEHALEDVDAILFVLAVDERIGPGDHFIAHRVFAAGVPVVVVVNKVDRVGPGEIARQIETAAMLGEFHALHPVSAKTGAGVEALRAELVDLLPEGPVFFPEGEVTDLRLELRIAELVREKALALTREEVPHAISVEVDEIANARVSAVVYVEAPSQKGIVVGRGGRMIREIGLQARPEIELLLGRKVFLELKVKVRPRWRRDEALLERMGI
ncbi:MAG: GTPase Era [Actinomycetota bacterium]|nr:GTPase Era [Actinomycetota bacterium]